MGCRSDVIKDTYEALLFERSALDKNVQLLEQIDQANAQLQVLDVNISEQKIKIAGDIRDAQGQINKLRSMFREIISSAIFLNDEQEGTAYFDVSLSPSRRRDQLPFKVSIEVPKAEALGRFMLKIVAYDLMVFLNAVRSEREIPRFIIHDGVFHGISKRTIIDTLNFVHHQSLLFPGFQYIVTFNQDDIQISNDRISVDGKFNFDIGDSVIAHYTDDPEGMIFKRIFS